MNTYGVVMTFNASAKNSIPLSRDQMGMKLSSRYIFCSRSRYSSQSTRKDPARAHERGEVQCFYEGLKSKYHCMFVYKVDGEHPASYSILLLGAQKLEDGQRPGTLYHPKMSVT